MKIYLSIQPIEKAGGSNTFAYNFAIWAKKNRYKITSSILGADVAIVIAHRGVTTDLLHQARQRNCFIIHRIDEHLGAIKIKHYQEKHQMIKELNAYADVTVFQSEFVKNTAHPFLNSRHHVVILNGGNPDVFHSARKPGTEIGHVTWGTDAKKRLDILYKEILARPDEQFRLIGRHKHLNDPKMAFRQKNVTLRGEKKRKAISAEYRKMKVLFFPSENDPCPNTAIEAILSGVPVCYHNSGGTPELVRDCGETLDRFDHLLENLEIYQERCRKRTDLYFNTVMDKYSSLWSREWRKKHDL